MMDYTFSQLFEFMISLSSSLVELIPFIIAFGFRLLIMPLGDGFGVLGGIGEYFDVRGIKLIYLFVIRNSWFVLVDVLKISPNQYVFRLKSIYLTPLFTLLFTLILLYFYLIPHYALQKLVVQLQNKQCIILYKYHFIICTLLNRTTPRMNPHA